MRDFKSDLQITENYHKAADRALKSLPSELETYYKENRVSAVCESALIGAFVGAAWGVGELIR